MRQPVWFACGDTGLLLDFSGYGSGLGQVAIPATDRANLTRKARQLGQIMREKAEAEERAAKVQAQAQHTLVEAQRKVVVAEHARVAAEEQAATLAVDKHASGADGGGGAAAPPPPSAPDACLSTAKVAACSSAATRACSATTTFRCASTSVCCACACTLAARSSASAFSRMIWPSCRALRVRLALSVAGIATWPSPEPYPEKSSSRPVSPQANQTG